jgi:hypothetical protein
VKKVESILAALHGKSIAKPIADEVVAQAILNKIGLFTYPAKGIKRSPDAACL